MPERPERIYRAPLPKEIFAIMDANPELAHKSSLLGKEVDVPITVRERWGSFDDDKEMNRKWTSEPGIEIEQGWRQLSISTSAETRNKDAATNENVRRGSIKDYRLFEPNIHDPNSGKYYPGTSAIVPGRIENTSPVHISTIIKVRQACLDLLAERERIIVLGVLSPEIANELKNIRWNIGVCTETPDTLREDSPVNVIPAFGIDTGTYPSINDFLYKPEKFKGLNASALEALQRDLDEIREWFSYELEQSGLYSIELRAYPKALGVKLSKNMEGPGNSTLPDVEVAGVRYNAPGVSDIKRVHSTVEEERRTKKAAKKKAKKKQKRKGKSSEVSVSWKVTSRPPFGRHSDRSGNRGGGGSILY